MNAEHAANMTEAEFDKALKTWMEGAQKLIDDNWERNKFTHAQSPLLVANRGSRYIAIQRIDRNKDGVLMSDKGSAHAFIDLTGGKVQGVPTMRGDVLKPAGWQAPAKHARGNIFDDRNGLGMMGPYGTGLLK